MRDDREKLIRSETSEQTKQRGMRRERGKEEREKGGH